MLRRVFGTLKIGLSAREQDLVQELNITKETAGKLEAPLSEIANFTTSESNQL